MSGVCFPASPCRRMMECFKLEGTRVFSAERKNKTIRVERKKRRRIADGIGTSTAAAGGCRSEKRSFPSKIIRDLVLGASGCGAESESRPFPARNCGRGARSRALSSREFFSSRRRRRRRRRANICATPAKTGSRRGERETLHSWRHS